MATINGPGQHIFTYILGQLLFYYVYPQEQEKKLLAEAKE